MTWVARKDLVATTMPNNEGYVVKDPLQNQFYFLSDLEFYVFNLLKAERAIGEIPGLVEKRFGFRPQMDELQSLLNRLISGNLLVSNRLGDGNRLLQQAASTSNRNLWSVVFKLLSIRIPGIYPGRILGLLSPFGALIFSKIAFLFFAVSWITTFFLGSLFLPSVVEKLSTQPSIFQFEYLLVVGILFVAIKCLHELGHGLACEHFGQECNEIGLMFLVFFPCLYCDVSNMWAETNKWKRIMVSFAGIYVELGLSLIFLWAWFHSAAGLANSVFFAGALITSANTIFVNGNPLMKFDGYFIFSDLVGVRNLSGRSRNELVSRFDVFLFGKSPIESGGEDSKMLFAYGLATLLYRLVIQFAIVAAVWYFFKGWSVELGKAGVVFLLTIFAMPMLLAFFRLLNMSFRNPIRYGNALLFLACSFTILFLISSVEFKDRVWGTARFKLANSGQIFSPSDGLFFANVKDGVSVQRNRIIGAVADESKQERLLELECDLVETIKELECLRLVTNLDRSEQSSKVAFLEEKKTALVNQLDEFKNEIGNLELRSNSDGILVAADYSNENSANYNSDVQSNSRRRFNFFDPKNAGIGVKRGQLLGYVGDPAKVIGVSFISEKDVNQVFIGQKVRVFSNVNGHDGGKIVRVSPAAQLPDKKQPFGQQDIQQDRHFIVEFELMTGNEILVGTERKIVLLGNSVSIKSWVQDWVVETFKY